MGDGTGQGFLNQAPRALTAIKQGQAAQQNGNLHKAIALYCVAASTTASFERVLPDRPPARHRSAPVRSAKAGNSYLAMAMRQQPAGRPLLRHTSAMRLWGTSTASGSVAVRGPLAQLLSTPSMSTLGCAPAPAKQNWSPCCATPWHHKVDARLVLAITIAESSTSTAAPFHPRTPRD